MAAGIVLHMTDAVSFALLGDFASSSTAKLGTWYGNV